MTSSKIVDRILDRAAHTEDPAEYARLVLRMAYCRSNELATALASTPLCYMAETLTDIGE